MSDISDEYMHEQLARTRVYTLVLLRPGPNYQMDGRDAIVWEHGRRNFRLRADGLLSIVGPVPDESDLCGICLFDATGQQAQAIMAGDPAVQAGIFTVETHPVRSFPGDGLPG